MGEYFAKWCELHPDWDVRLWTDASMREFVAAEYPDFLNAYDDYPRPIQRADSFRYLVLNALGGVYSDLDVEPFRSINGLVEGLECFAGIEPDEHMGADRRHSGTPFLVSNAFMGGVAGHAWFRKLVEMLPKMAHNRDVFFSTGPSLTTGASVRLPRVDRPKLVPPMLWSPHCDKGKPCTTDFALQAMLEHAFDFAWADREAFVSHHWLTSWEPWHKQHKWLAEPFHAFHALKWKWRAWRHPELARIDIPDQLVPYTDQTETPLVILPNVTICVSVLPQTGLVPAFVKSLARLIYPREKLKIIVATASQNDSENLANALKSESLLAGVEVESLAVSVPKATHLLLENQTKAVSAVLRNALADAATDTDFVMFVGGEVEDMPALVLKQALETAYPVVGLPMVDEHGNEVDQSVYRYHWGGGIRVTYKIRGDDGLASSAKGQRDYLTDQKSYRLLPLDGVGRGFVLVDRAVLDAGVQFAETPMDLHLDGEAFALSARRAGFEVAGMTEVQVVCGG